MNKIRKYIEQANAIYILLQHADRPESDALAIIFHELMDLIIYGNFKQLKGCMI